MNIRISASVDTGVRIYAPRRNTPTSVDSSLGISEGYISTKVGVVGQGERTVRCESIAPHYALK